MSKDLVDLYPIMTESLGVIHYFQWRSKSHMFIYCVCYRQPFTHRSSASLVFHISHDCSAAWKTKVSPLHKLRISDSLH